MKRIIDGVTYNTDTSTLIAQVEGKWTKNDGIEYDYLEQLYQTRGGAFFVHEHLEGTYHDQAEGEWRTKKLDAFTPNTHEEATAWLNETDNVEIFSDALGNRPKQRPNRRRARRFTFVFLNL